jgi:hypothetical protein
MSNGLLRQKSASPLLDGVSFENCEVHISSGRICNCMFNCKGWEPKCLCPDKHRLYEVMDADCPCLREAGLVEVHENSTIKGWQIDRCIIRLPKNWSRWKRWRFNKTNTLQKCRIE